MFNFVIFSKGELKGMRGSRRAAPVNGNEAPTEDKGGGHTCVNLGEKILLVFIFKVVFSAIIIKTN